VPPASGCSTRSGTRAAPILPDGSGRSRRRASTASMPDMAHCPTAGWRGVHQCIATKAGPACSAVRSRWRAAGHAPALDAATVRVLALAPQLPFTRRRGEFLESQSAPPAATAARHNARRYPRLLPGPQEFPR
jgi:hypothetical protein